MLKIKVLKTNGISGLKVHEVGVDGVTEINDNCVDAEQNYISQYTVWVDNKMKYSYEMGSYEIEYFGE